jgi:hypothetical protein
MIASVLSCQDTEAKGILKIDGSSKTTHDKKREPQTSFAAHKTN